MSLYAIVKLGAGLVLWFVLGTIEVLVEQPTGRLAPSVDVAVWWVQIALGPTVVATVGFVLLIVLARSTLRSSVLQKELRLSSGRLARTILVLLVLRGVSLSSVVTAWFPVLALLWSPPVNWAVALSVLFTTSGHLRSYLRPTISVRRMSVLLFGGWVVVYASWTLYVCQMTIVHGDEGHYLRVVQSLLRDGDVDLANNLEPNYTSEFSPVPFDVHIAPASPADKVYSLHPPGMSVLVAPAYALGLRWWGNPRLSTALFMAMLSAACVAMLYRWLEHMGAGRGAAFVTSSMIASTAPLFLYSSQIYPDVPGLLALLILLCSMAHLLRPGEASSPLGGWHVLRHAALAVMMGALAFIHTRFIPISALGGVLLIADAIRSPKPKLCLGVITAIVIAAVATLVYSNFQMTGDWLGGARPGNMWSYEISIWGMPITLKDHWLISGQGLLNSAPVFLLAPVGLGLLVVQKDRRFLFVLVLYAVTVGVNGMAGDISTGYQYAGRYLIVGMPAISLCFAMALRHLWRRPWGQVLTTFLLVVSWETVWQAARAPEMAYKEFHLRLRSVGGFYPWDAHFPTHGEVPWSDLTLWLGLACGLCVLLWLPAKKYIPKSLGLAQQ